MTATFDHTTHPRPELEFLEVPLDVVYRRLNAAGEPWSRALKAGCLEMVAAAQEGRELPAPRQAAGYRRMLRRLLELQATPPPKNGSKAGKLTASRKRATRSYLNSAGQGGKIVPLRAREVAELGQLQHVA